MTPEQIVGISLGLGTVAVLLLIVFIKSNVVICHPNEILVLSGRKRRLDDGRTVGYRIIHGGKAFKVPFVESVARLSLTSIPVEVRLAKVLCAGMIPINIEGRANVKLAGRETDGLDAAIERFLGKGVDAVTNTAKQALEGALRGVVSELAPERANAERLQAAEAVTTHARPALSRLGIVLDFFLIQNISDDQGYLEAIGRKRTAQVQRDAKIAEAEADAESRRVAAEQRRLGREAEIAAERKIIEAENGLATQRAELAAGTNRAEQKAAVAGEIARVEEQIELETKREVLVAHREQAATVIPARARAEAVQLEAGAAASRIFEDGQATARAIELMREQWQGGESRDLFMIRMYPELLGHMTKVVAQNLRVDKLTILDAGDGNGLPSHVRNLTKSVVSVFEQLKGTTGIDLAAMATPAAPNGSSLPKELG